MGRAAVKNIRHIFAIGRAQHAGKTQIGRRFGRQIKLLVFARLQIIAARKDNAVVFGQLHAGSADGINAHHLLRALVVNQIAHRAFTVRAYAQQNQPAQFRVGNFGIAQRLAGVFHRLAVNAQARFGIVFHLHGQIAARGFNKNRVQNIDVRMPPAHVLLARDGRPFKIMAGGQGNIAFAAIVHISQAAVGFMAPAEYANILVLLPDLK